MPRTGTAACESPIPLPHVTSSMEIQFLHFPSPLHPNLCSHHLINDTAWTVILHHIPVVSLTHLHNPLPIAIEQTYSPTPHIAERKGGRRAIVRLEPPQEDMPLTQQRTTPRDPNKFPTTQLFLLGTSSTTSNLHRHFEDLTC